MSGLGWSYRLFSIDLRSLALFRIGIAAILLFDLAAYRFPEFDAFYADDGMFSVEHAQQWLGNTSLWSVCLINGAEEFQTAMLALTGAFAFLLLLGWRTRWMTAGCWVMAVSIANRNQIVCNYGDTMLHVFLFWSLFLPLGAKWSLDARRNRRAGKREPNGNVCSVASAAALLQLSFVYLFTGIWKWNADWLGGTAAETALQLEYARRDSSLDQLLYTPLLQPLTIATLFLELLGPLVIWIPWRTHIFRLAMTIAFILLHVSIELLFTPALLSYTCMVAWLLFLPSAFWESGWMQRLIGKPSEAARNSTAINREPITALAKYSRRLSNGVCLTLLIYVLLWNLATLPFRQLEVLLPQNARWIGHITMLGQRWDMFYRPSEHNGWYKARARLADGTVVDVLRNGEPFDANSLESNWSYYRSIRWKLFFRRLGIWEGLEPLGDPVAEYLRDRWNSQHPEDQHAVELTLLYYERLDDSSGGGFTVRTFGSAATENGSDWESLLNPLDSLLSSNFKQGRLGGTNVASAEGR